MARTRSAADAFDIAGSKTASTARTAKAATEPASRAAQPQPEPAPRVTAKTQKRQANGEDRRAVTAYIPRDLFNDLRAKTCEEDCSITNVVIDALELYLRGESN